MNYDIKLKDIYITENTSFYSLKQLVGQGIKDIEFCLVKSGGSVHLSPINVILDDDTLIALEGSEDWVFLETYKNNVKNLDDNTLNRLYAEENESYD
jgi:hypothetical protein